MTARFLVRLDDACHTMDRARWAAIEAVLDEFGVRPIVAVVPDNKDPDLQMADVDPDFWCAVRRWRDKGWAIAMHGYQHVLRETNARMLLPFYRRSEFAGLAYAQQAEKVRASLALFRANGVEPTVWVAPAHCFDETTLRALERETAIRVVSDGIARSTFRAHGFDWVPQQLWSFAPKRSGVWTVCLHPGSLDAEGLAKLVESLRDYRETITSLDEVFLSGRPLALSDRIYAAGFWARHRAMPFLLRIRAAFRG